MLETGKGAQEDKQGAGSYHLMKVFFRQALTSGQCAILCSREIEPPAAAPPPPNNYYHRSTIKSCSLLISLQPFFGKGSGGSILGVDQAAV